MSATYYGIDFGTSNSTIARADATGARLLPLEGAHETLPSAVFWEEDGGAPLFGRTAIAAYVEGFDGRLMRGLKSTLGSSLIQERTRVGKRNLAFTEIIGAFFGHLRERLNAQAEAPAESVVLGRPVHFVDDDAEGDRAAQNVLEEIARAQGFRNIDFQYEPIAAALHYEQSLTAEELVLIVDIGGGTSDFSIVRVSPERAQQADRQADILANDGIRVGGTDFDRLLSLSQVMPHLGLNSGMAQGNGLMPRHYFNDLATWHRINTLYTQRVESDLKALRALAARKELLDRMIRVIQTRAGHSLALATEKAKIALSAETEARIRLAPLTGGPDADVRREVFETAVEMPMARIGQTIRALLEAAGLRADQIGTVFLTGGSSSLPVLHAGVAEVLPGVPRVTGDLLGSVGTGLALDARRKFR